MHNDLLTAISRQVDVLMFRTSKIQDALLMVINVDRCRG